MIPLALRACAEGDIPYVATLGSQGLLKPLFVEPRNSQLAAFSGPNGLLAVEGAHADQLEGDVVLVDPIEGRVERLIRSGSLHNTLLVTERCDQLCVMCSQPPKKTHVDRFALLEEACLLAEAGSTLGITGGEPLLFKDQLLGMIERVRFQRPDISFHVLTNGQHFSPTDAARLSGPAYDRVQWGIPIYSSTPHEHDRIVGKDGAFERLEDSLATLAISGASIELRTVVLTANVERLPHLADYVRRRLPFAATWSIMQLENIGFARGRWAELRFNHCGNFSAIGKAIDRARLFSTDVRLFNFPRCTVPSEYRELAVASISDWKQRFSPRCEDCGEKAKCSGFFEWHPTDELEATVRPL